MKQNSECSHDKIKTWGAGSDKPKQWWRSIADDLIRQEALFQDAEAYNAMKLTDKGRNILYNREPFFIIRKEQQKLKSAAFPKFSAKNYDREMFEMLKDYRAELAAERRVPPYLIFSDKSLKDMCIVKPLDNAGFLRVHGVGERKLEEYGPPFLPRIREYLGY